MEFEREEVERDFKIRMMLFDSIERRYTVQKCKDVRDNRDWKDYRGSMLSGCWN